MAKQNCWEFKKCGREPGGANVKALGICPAATYLPAHGFLGGRMGGRGCAYITGTFCAGNIQGTFAEKEKECAVCDFYLTLKREHGAACSVLEFTRYVKDRQ